LQPPTLSPNDPRFTTIYPQMANDHGVSVTLVMHRSSQPTNARGNDWRLSLALFAGRVLWSRWYDLRFHFEVSRAVVRYLKTPHLNPQSLRAVDLGAILTPQTAPRGLQTCTSFAAAVWAETWSSGGLLKSRWPSPVCPPAPLPSGAHARENWIANAASA